MNFTDFSDGERRTLMLALGKLHGDADDPVAVDRLAARVHGPKLEGGWATYQVGKTPDGGRGARVERARVLARTQAGMGEPDDQIRVVLASYRFPDDVIEEAMEGCHV